MRSALEAAAVRAAPNMKATEMARMLQALAKLGWQAGERVTRLAPAGMAMPVASSTNPQGTLGPTSSGNASAACRQPTECASCHKPAQANLLETEHTSGRACIISHYALRFATNKPWGDRSSSSDEDDEACALARRDSAQHPVDGDLSLADRAVIDLKPDPSQEPRNAANQSLDGAAQAASETRPEEGALAISLMSQGKYSEAEPMLRALYKAELGALGLEHPVTL